ncbi:MAG: class II fructose-bisphosphate aldolase [Desulfohalobiaceae bacterium]|nr:class II fructose-bisphosphate aldolase [Desulfohalobiaceae bacterium]
MSQSDFDRCLETGRPPNIQHLFPHSRALLVSGKYIDRAMTRKGQAVAMAANARNSFVLRGALLGAQKANAGLIIEIARSEGGAKGYCAVNLWNMALMVDAACNELGITVPVAVHGDHYGIKKESDIEPARTEIPTLFESGITSIAIDASHMPDDQNLLTSLDLIPLVPQWASLETEVGEIKGKTGISTVEEALFLIRGLNAHSVFPNWIALNNGSTHGLEESGLGIQVDLTREIHQALAPYKVNGAQHGTSGNSSDRLKEIATRTRTTKANVATALQMVSWGVEVNDYGNAILNENGEFSKIKGRGVSSEIWEEMTAYARERGWNRNNYKWLNLPFEARLLGQPREIRQRMVKAVEDFVYEMLVNVFNAADSAPLVYEDILKSGSYDPGTSATRVEDPAEWTREKIIERAGSIASDKGEEGDFED